MSGSTATEGYPYPLESDFADVQDAFRLALAIDADLRAEQAPFRAFEGRPSFIGRQVANNSAPGSLQLTATDWDNTGGIFTSGWTQPTSQQPSWWLFGCTILVAIISGTPVVGELNLGVITVTTTDQVSGVASSTSYYQRNDETNTNGEWVNFFAAAPIYQGSVQCSLLTSGTAVKAAGAGSRFWGMYLGPVT